MVPQFVPDVVFHTRVRNDALDGPNPFEWKDVSTDDLFSGKKSCPVCLARSLHASMFRQPSAWL